MGHLEAGLPASDAARCLRGEDCLVEGARHVGRLVAHVGRVQAAAPGGRRDDGGDLPGPGMHPGRVDQPGRDAHGSRVERLLGVRDHGCQLGVVRRSVVRAEDRAPDGAVADEEGDVEAQRLGVDRLEVLRERGPRRHELAGVEVRLNQRPGRRRERGERVAAVAGQLGRVPLPQVARERPVDQRRRVRVAVRVDEAGCDHEAGSVDDRLDLAVGHRRQVPDGRNPVARDADVGRATGRARSVDEEAAANQKIETHRPRSYRAGVRP